MEMTEEVLPFRSGESSGEGEAKFGQLAPNARNVGRTQDLIVCERCGRHSRDL